MDDRPDSVMLGLSPEGPWDVLSLVQGSQTKSFLNVGDQGTIPLVAEPSRKSQTSQLEMQIRSNIKVRVVNMAEIASE